MRRKAIYTELPLLKYLERQGELAQMVERSIRIREARGSIPRFSTRNFEKASTRKQATTRKFAPKRCEIIYYYMHHLHLVLLMQ